MENPKSYELTLINDILHKVPADRIMECMMEIGASFTAMKTLIEGSGASEGSYSLPETHTWVDDGKNVVGFSLANSSTDKKVADVRILPELSVSFVSEQKNQQEDKE